MNQIELHKKIDALILKSFTDVGQKEVSALISVNEDVRRYFFAKVDERWISWLWGNGFLDAIKQKAKDPTRYGYKTPELDYLVRITEKVPARVVDIILVVPVSAETFNPEVVDRFLWICSTLPAEQLARVVQKIRDEKWILLMGMFNQWGFEYEKMFEIFGAAKDYKSILILAEAVLSVRTKEDIEKISHGFSSDNPFYFSDFSYTKVFECLVNVSDDYVEQALALAVKVMGEVILLCSKTNNSGVFPIEETFYLFDVDFFTLGLGEEKHLSSKDNVRELAAVIKTLADRLIGKRCTEDDSARKIYEQYIESLPKSRLMWRLQLFILTLCPEALKDKLKRALFRLFEVERYHELISDTEYQKALRVGFHVLSEVDKREYVGKVLTYFSKHAQDKKDQDWHKTYGLRILSSICPHLTREENIKCEQAFGEKCDPNYEPEPSVKFGEMGTVIPQAPITFEEFQKMTIPQVVDNLRGEWAPKALAEKYKDKVDFHRPINAEGIASLMKKDMTYRATDYLTNAQLFFDRESLDSHYTYSFLLGLYELLRGKKLVDVDINALLIMLSTIVASGQKKVFDHSVRERESFGEWLGGWTAVHNAMADVTKELLRDDNKLIVDFAIKRDLLLKLITYLLEYPDPVVSEEREVPTRTNSRGEIEYIGSDPFTEAINSVRGRTFEAFVFFTYHDDGGFAKEADVKIANEVKQIYEELLSRENTRAMMFIFGHYLPSFYFRSKAWIRGLLPQIFMQDIAKKDLYLAAWEGLLTNNLYGEMFFDPAIADLYNRGIELKSDDYTKRRYFKDIDEALATHLALAFIHFPGFGFEQDLFKKFWGTENPKRHKEFISFIGRHCISRERADLWTKENKVDIAKLKKFWDWALKNCNADALTGFGFWINKEHGVLETKWLAQHVHQTLEKTKGYIEWDYGLMNSLPIFAKEAPEDTLAILRFHLLEEIAKHDPPRTWRLQIDTELIDIFKTIYENPTMKEGVRTLINDLLPYRNGLFWGLKSVLDEENKK